MVIILGFSQQLENQIRQNLIQIFSKNSSGTWKSDSILIIEDPNKNDLKNNL